jgi:hypothetical protein
VKKKTEDVDVRLDRLVEKARALPPRRRRRMLALIEQTRREITGRRK